MNQNFLLNILKDCVINKNKQKIILESLKRIFLYSKKLSNKLFIISFNKKSLKQLEMLYKKLVLNSKINTISVKLWLTATGEINYSILSWRELDFVYKAMPKLQKVLVYMNAGNKKWLAYFINLLKFVSKINKEVLENFPKAIDWQLLNYITSKMLELSNNKNSKIKKQQAYGYVKFLLDMFIESANFEKNMNFIIQKKIDIFMEDFFKRIIVFYNLTYSPRSKNQINSQNIVKTFIPFLNRLFLSKNNNQSELIIQYFSILIKKINLEEKRKRFDLKSETLLSLLENFKDNNWIIDDLSKHWMSFVLSSLRQSYLQYLKYFDTYEIVFIINLMITSLFLFRFNKDQK